MKNEKPDGLNEHALVLSQTLDPTLEPFAAVVAANDLGEHREFRPLCVDCGGWPIPGGAVFIPVAIAAESTRIVSTTVSRGVVEAHTESGCSKIGFICELCYLRRLERRGGMVNHTSSRCCWVKPELLNQINRYAWKLSELIRYRRESGTASSTSTSQARSTKKDLAAS